MARSALDSRFEKGDEFIDQIRDEQLERLRRVGDLWRSTMADWEDLAKAEDSVRREYLCDPEFCAVEGFLISDNEASACDGESQASRLGGA